MAKGWIWGQEQVCQRLKESSGKRPGWGKGEGGGCGWMEGRWVDEKNRMGWGEGGREGVDDGGKE